MPRKPLREITPEETRIIDHASLLMKMHDIVGHAEFTPKNQDGRLSDKPFKLRFGKAYTRMDGQYVKVPVTAYHKTVSFKTAQGLLDTLTRMAEANFR